MPKESLDFAFFHAHGVAFRQCACRRQSLRLSDQASFTHAFVNAQDGDYCFLALLGYDGDFDFALFSVENCISVIALRKDDFPFCNALKWSGPRLRSRKRNRIKPPRASRRFGTYAPLAH
jgi:hypothetical protein